MTDIPNAFLSIFEKLPFKATASVASVASGFVASTPPIPIHYSISYKRRKNCTGSHWPLGLVKFLLRFATDDIFKLRKKEIKEEILEQLLMLFHPGKLWQHILLLFILPPRGSSDNNPVMHFFVFRKCTQIPQILKLIGLICNFRVLTRSHLIFLRNWHLQSQQKIQFW